MRPTVRRTSIIDDDLPVVAVEDLAESADEAALARLPWTRIAAFGLAVVAVVALVTISWQGASRRGSPATRPASSTPRRRRR
jgi:hypothetical protein